MPCPIHGENTDLRCVQCLPQIPSIPTVSFSERVFRAGTLPPLEPMERIRSDRELLLSIERKLDKLIGFFMREEEDAG